MSYSGLSEETLTDCSVRRGSTATGLPPQFCSSTESWANLFPKYWGLVNLTDPYPDNDWAKYTSERVLDTNISSTPVNPLSIIWRLQRPHGTPPGSSYIPLHQLHAPCKSCTPLHQLHPCASATQPCISSTPQQQLHTPCNSCTTPAPDTHAHSYIRHTPLQQPHPHCSRHTSCSSCTTLERTHSFVPHTYTSHFFWSCWLFLCVG